MKKISKMLVFTFLFSVLFQGTFFIGAEKAIAVDPPATTVIISEFATDPDGICNGVDTGADEWFELLNTTSSPIDLSGWGIVRQSLGVAPEDMIMLSGTIPAMGILVFSGSCAPENDAGDVLVLNNGENPVFGIYYGTLDPAPEDLTLVRVETAPGSGESARMVSRGIEAEWYVDESLSMGWFNADPENPFNPADPGAAAPTLAELDSFIESEAGVITNFGDIENPSAAEGLYFENEMGKIDFPNELNLTDFDTFMLLLDLGEALMIDMDSEEEVASTIGLNASTAEDIRTSGATLSLYGLGGLEGIGFRSADSAVIDVYDDSLELIGEEDEDYPELEILEYSEDNGGTLVFTASHFTFFKVSSSEDWVKPTVLWAKITGGNEITIKFSELIDTAEIEILDFETLLITDGELENDPRNIVDMDVGEEGGTDTVVLTFDAEAVGEDATGLISMNVEPLTIQDMSGNVMDGVIGFPVTDGQGNNTTITNSSGSVDVVSGNDGTVDVSALITDLEGVLPGITINSDIGSGAIVNVQIPEGVTVTGGTGWDGTINVPTVKANNTVSGVSGTISKVIEIGANNIPLSFDKGVRILIPGQSGKSAGYYRSGTFTPIATICSADSQEAGDALVDNGDCKKDVGSDLVIWTKHFTSFVTYTASSGGSSSYSPSPSPSPSPDPSPEPEDEDDGEVTILPVIQGSQMQFRQQVRAQLSTEEVARRAQLMRGSYLWEYITQSAYPAALAPGEEVDVWVEVKNIGTATWFHNGDNVVRLGSGSKYGNQNQNRDYHSEFANPDWYSENRPANIMHPEVRPGWHTRFQFKLRAPATPGVYKAYFTPVIDGMEWMNDIGLYWQVTVAE